MKTPQHGDIVEFSEKSGGHNYVAIFEKFEDDKVLFWCRRFLVHRSAAPTLKYNEGVGERACFYTKGYGKLKVLRRKTLP